VELFWDEVPLISTVEMLEVKFLKTETISCFLLRMYALQKFFLFQLQENVSGLSYKDRLLHQRTFGFYRIVNFERTTFLELSQNFFQVKIQEFSNKLL